MSGLVRARVGDIAEQVRGVSYGKEDASRIPQEGYLPVLRAGNITDEGLVFEDLVYVPSARIAQKQLVQKGDVVIAASSGSLDVVGKAAPATNAFNGGFGAFCKVLRPRAVVDATFFAHFFKTGDYRRRISSLAAGANINNLKNEHLDDLEIPLPPLPEQRRIAAILDQADTLRTQRRAALAQLDSLTQSLFLDMFGDPVTNPMGWPMGKIADLLESASYGTSEKSDSVGAYPVLRMNNLTRTGELNLTDLKYMDLQPSALERYLAKPGDVLFNRTNSAELVGKTAMVPADAPALAYAGYLVRLRLNAQNEPVYLTRFLNTDYAKRMLRSMCKSIVGMANINAKEIQAMKIALPPLPLQQTFATRVQAIEALKAQHRAALATQDALFASLQQRAFSGAL